jgi:hypothetical protein
LTRTTHLRFGPANPARFGRHQALQVVFLPARGFLALLHALRRHCAVAYRAPPRPHLFLNKTNCRHLQRKDLHIRGRKGTKYEVEGISRI